MRDDIEAVAGLCLEREAIARVPAPFFAGGRVASGIAFGYPLQPEILRAGSDKVWHQRSPSVAFTFRTILFLNVVVRKGTAVLINGGAMADLGVAIAKRAGDKKLMGLSPGG
jgi:hypothetical protein